MNELELSLAGTYLVGVDLGGTKIMAAVVDNRGHLVARAKMPTGAEGGPDQVLGRIQTVVEKTLEKAGVGREAVAAVGVGAPAPVDPAAGVVYAAPNLPGWDRVPLGHCLTQMLGMRVFTDNDVNVGTLGEHVLGAGQGVRDMVGVFVGTGIGGGVILGGELRRGFRNAAGEVGHMVVLPGGPRCGCGRQGCLEAVASRTAIEHEVRAALQAGRPSMVADLLAASRRKRLTSGLIAKAVSRRDPLMLEVLRKSQYYLGLAIANIANVLDPEMFVLGGGVVEALGDEFLKPIREVARAHFKQQLYAERVRIVAALLGDDAGVLGAAILASQQMEKLD